MSYHFKVYPEVPIGVRDAFINMFNGKSQHDWLAEGLEDKPFGEWIFWARRIMTETIVKESKYSIAEYRKTNPQANMNPLDFYNAYQAWKEKQPDEGDLTTPFGHRMIKWFENPQVYESFRLAYSTIGWYLIDKSKQLAKQQANGSLFLEADWSAILHARQSMATIDGALYRMDMHNAGAWDLEPEMAGDFIWIDLLFAFAKSQNRDFTPYYTTFDKVRARNSDYCWWYNLHLKYKGNEHFLLPDELEKYAKGTTLSFPYEDGTIEFDFS